MSTTANHTGRVMLLSKYPEAGHAKTRLQPALGEAGAARLGKRLLEHCADQAAASMLDLTLCVQPDPSDVRWQTLNLPPNAAWVAQSAGDLGARMAHASQQGLQTHERVLLIGSDCPDLTGERITQAAQALDEHDVVMIPAYDGGYVLLGMRRFDAQLFADIEWSTSSVAAVTQARIDALGWHLALLPKLHDIDEPEDLQYLPTHWSEHQAGR